MSNFQLKSWMALWNLGVMFSLGELFSAITHKHVPRLFQCVNILPHNGGTQFGKPSSYPLVCEPQTSSFCYSQQCFRDEKTIGTASFSCQQSWTHHYSLWKLRFCSSFWSLHWIQYCRHSSPYWKTTLFSSNFHFCQITMWPCRNYVSLGWTQTEGITYWWILDDSRGTGLLHLWTQDSWHQRGHTPTYRTPILRWTITAGSRHNVHGCKDIVTPEDQLDNIETYEEITAASYFQAQGLPESFVQRLGMAEVRVLSSHQFTCFSSLDTTSSSQTSIYFRKSNHVICRFHHWRFQSFCKQAV